MKYAVVIFVVCFPLLCETIRDLRGYTFSTVEKIKQFNLKEFLSDHQYACIYYFTRVRPELEQLYESYDAVADHIKVSNEIYLGFVDCSNTKEGTIPECAKEKTEYSLFTYVKGNLVREVKLKKPFTYDSISGAILTSFLKTKLPYIKSEQELRKLEKTNIGKKNVVLLYVKKFDTPAHRSILELAKSMDSVFQFSIINKEVVDILHDNEIKKKDNAALWVLMCAEAKKSKCPSIRFKREVDLSNLGAFFLLITLPPVIKIPSEYEENTYSAHANSMYVYYSSKNSGKVQKLVKELKPLLRGIVVIAMINVDQKKMYAEHGHNGETPAISVQKKTETPHFLTDKITVENIVKFVQKILFKSETPMPEKVEPTVEQTMRENIMKPEKSKQQPMDQPTEQPTEESAVNVEDLEPIDIAQILTEDDHVAESVARLKEKLPLDKFLVLTDETFPEKILEDELTFIVFYHPFISKSVAVLWTYVEVADKLGDKIKLAVVNCYDWTDICTEEGITVYPTLRYYRRGEYLPYKGAYDTRAMVSTIKLLLSANPLELTSTKAVKEFIKNTRSDVDTYSAVVIGLFDKKDKNEMKDFVTAAYHLHGVVQFVAFTSKEAVSIAGWFWPLRWVKSYGNESQKLQYLKSKEYKTRMPSVILLKPSDKYQPHIPQASNFTTEGIVEFVKTNRIPTLPELTALMYPILSTRNQPMAVLFVHHTSDAEKEKDTMVKISKSFDEITCCYMKVNPGQNIGHAILQEYRNTTNYKLPALTLVNHAEGSIYNFGENLEYGTISKWIKKIKKGALKPSKKLTEDKWEPLSTGFDFQLIRELELTKGIPITMQQGDALRKITEKQKRLREKRDLLMEQEMEISASEADIKEPPTMDEEHIHSEL